MPDNFATLRRELDMAQSAINQHGKSIGDMGVKLDEVYRWQGAKNMRDARQEEREKQIVQKLETIHQMTKAVVVVLMGGIGTAIVAFIVNGGLRI